MSLSKDRVARIITRTSHSYQRGRFACEEAAKRLCKSTAGDDTRNDYAELAGTIWIALAGARANAAQTTAQTAIAVGGLQLGLMALHRGAS